MSAQIGEQATRAVLSLATTRSLDLSGETENISKILQTTSNLPVGPVNPFAIEASQPAAASQVDDESFKIPTANQRPFSYSFQGAIREPPAYRLARPSVSVPRPGQPDALDFTPRSARGRRRAPRRIIPSSGPVQGPIHISAMSPAEQLDEVSIPYSTTLSFTTPPPIPNENSVEMNFDWSRQPPTFEPGTYSTPMEQARVSIPEDIVDISFPEDTPPSFTSTLSSPGSFGSFRIDPPSYGDVGLYGRPAQPEQRSYEAPPPSTSASPSFRIARRPYGDVRLHGRPVQSPPLPPSADSTGSFRIARRPYGDVRLRGRPVQPELRSYDALPFVTPEQPSFRLARRPYGDVRLHGRPVQPEEATPEAPSADTTGSFRISRRPYGDVRLHGRPAQPEEVTPEPSSADTTGSFRIARRPYGDARLHGRPVQPELRSYDALPFVTPERPSFRLARRPYGDVRLHGRPVQLEEATPEPPSADTTGSFRIARRPYGDVRLHGKPVQPELRSYDALPFVTPEPPSFRLARRPYGDVRLHGRPVQPEEVTPEPPSADTTGSFRIARRPYGDVRLHGRPVQPELRSYDALPFVTPEQPSFRLARRPYGDVRLHGRPVQPEEVTPEPPSANSTGSFRIARRPYGDVRLRGRPVQPELRSYDALPFVTPEPPSAGSFRLARRPYGDIRLHGRPVQPEEATPEPSTADTTGSFRIARRPYGDVRLHGRPVQPEQSLEDIVSPESVADYEQFDVQDVRSSTMNQSRLTPFGSHGGRRRVEVGSRLASGWSRSERLEDIEEEFAPDLSSTLLDEVEPPKDADAVSELFERISHQADELRSRNE
ncbi:uncharacterized protein LOC131683871 [Topomyia yanbarensis]|uniref:uncharacterized protein LOC131683871 n=1 Tax=Topomyia yanbarensis TaxID=2498891 RepID=UPI00273C1D83|nr:uncharacterized protein LOC131683871 [Topomyia yanbarensis]